MRFKDWHQLDEARYKGFLRQFRGKHPDVPEYVLKQMYSGHMSPGMTDAISGLSKPTAATVASAKDNTPSFDPTAPTIAYVNKGRPNQKATAGRRGPPKGGQKLPSEIMKNNDHLTGVRWTPKPVVVEVRPTDFAKETTDIFMLWKFGLNSNDVAVRNDTQRFATQTTLASQRTDGNNEPIIMVRENGRYKLVEGFHRTMSYLLSFSAPPDQAEALRGDDMSRIDFNSWKPVRLKAYVGEREGAAPPSQTEPADNSPTISIRRPPG